MSDVATDLFDRWSRTYDDGLLQRSTYRPIHDDVVRLVDELGPRRVLDVGCGTGRLAQRLRRCHHAPDVVGLDAAGGMLRSARRSSAPPLHVARADASALPIADRSIGLVTCVESFHWYPDQSAALREFRRVLGSGGTLVLAGLATVTAVGERLVRSATRRRAPVRALPPRSLNALLAANGFTVLEQRRIVRFPAPWPLITRAEAT